MPKQGHFVFTCLRIESKYYTFTRGGLRILRLSCSFGSRKERVKVLSRLRWIRSRTELGLNLPKFFKFCFFLHGLSWRMEKFTYSRLIWIQFHWSQLKSFSTLPSVTQPNRYILMLDNLNRLLLPVYHWHFRCQTQTWTHLRWEKLKSTRKANNYCMLNSKFRHILILLFDSPSFVQNLSLYRAFSWLAS